MAAWNHDPVINGNGTPISPPTNGFLSKNGRFSPKLVEINPNVDAAVLSPTQTLSSSPGGKSGRVIERLQSENERLKRDLNYERRQREETGKSLALAKSTEDSLRERVENLHMCQETDKKSLERKERRIQELKKALDVEVTRRGKAESNASEMAEELDRTNTSANQRVAEATSSQKHAEVQEETLKVSYLSLKEEVKKVTRRVFQVRQEREDDLEQFKFLELVLDDTTKGMADKDHLVGQLATEMEAYHKLMDDCIAGLMEEHARMKQRADEHAEVAEQLLTELKETKDKMNWVMNMDRHYNQE